MLDIALKEPILEGTAAGSPADHRRVGQAILYLAREFRSQPPLDRVAAVVGLSPHHFQRVFTRWAGVSPKRFVQYLTAEHAKSLLRGSASVLETAFDSGLSGPGRLHDLVVSVEAMTPGEVKRGGEGLEVRFGFHPTPFGECLVAVTARGVCGLTFLGAGGRGEAVSDLARSWPRARRRQDPEATSAIARGVFGQGGRAQQLRLLVAGTNLQVKVWSALLRVPAGSAVSYGDLARSVGHPGAARAVGSALARNPIAVLIPCHRVLRATGAFGEYRWGADRKRALLAWESAKAV
jgi:AraC family transcriptional regulator, regulatory protein of adaptative response / methylated-DNA-[protein]-cysteine methyltransferase